MDGIVLEWIQTWDFAHGKIEGNDGVWYRAAGNEIELDVLGRCFLEPGESVTFLPSRGMSRKGRNFPTAQNVSRPWKETKADWHMHREICLVKNSDWVVRELVGGGGLLVLDRRDSAGLREGMVIECGVRPPPLGFRTWLATSPIWLANSEEEDEQSLLVSGGS